MNRYRNRPARLQTPTAPITASVPPPGGGTAICPCIPVPRWPNAAFDSAGNLWFTDTGTPRAAFPGGTNGKVSGLPTM